MHEDELPQSSPVTVKDILSALQDVYTVDSLAETTEDWVINFHDPSPFTIGTIPQGAIRNLKISKGMVKSIADGVREFSLEMLGGEVFRFRYFSWVELECSTSIVTFGDDGSPAVIRYKILGCSDDSFEIEVGGAKDIVTVDVYEDEGHNGGTITFTPNSSGSFIRECALSIRCGSRTQSMGLTLVRDNLTFSDGIVSRSYSFPEYARCFGIDLLQPDPGVSVIVPDDCLYWIAADVSTVERSGRKVTSVCITIDDNNGDIERNAVIRVKGSSGLKELTLDISQIGAKMPGALRRGLEAFYGSLDGDGWYENAGWCSEMSVATWYGLTPARQIWSEAFGKSRMIYCGDDSDWSLDICNNNLHGVIPDEFWDICHHFSKISIRDEHLESSSIPERIWHDDLREVCFSRTFIGGHLSPSVAGAVNIEVIDFNECRLTGGIPSEIAQLHSLRRFNACNCSLSGTLPEDIGNLKELVEFNICDNLDVCGTLPESFYDLRNLSEFDISDTKVGGTLSKRIGEMVNLRRFVISCCEFEGRIPEELGTIPGIAADCDGNYFTEIPEYVRYSGYGRSWTDMGGIFPAGIPFWQRKKSDGRPEDFLIKNPNARIEISRGSVKVRSPRYHVNYSRMYMLPFEEWARARYGLTGWNTIDPELAKRPKYPNADDLPFPADEYRFDGTQWIH